MSRSARQQAEGLPESQIPGTVHSTTQRGLSATAGQPVGDAWCRAGVSLIVLDNKLKVYQRVRYEVQYTVQHMAVIHCGPTSGKPPWPSG